MMQFQTLCFDPFLPMQSQDNSNKEDLEFSKIRICMFLVFHALLDFIWNALDE